MKYMKTAGLLCSEDGCDRPVRSRGLCAKHYDRSIRLAVCVKCGGKKSRGSSTLCRSCFLAEWDKLPAKKMCPTCSVEKLAEDFGVRQDSRGNQKLRSICKACAVEAARSYRDSLDPEVLAERRRVAKQREKERLKLLPVEQKFWRSIRISAQRLGLDVEAVTEYVKQHGNVCEACGKTCSYEKLGRAVLDHDHSTGEFRGLLCGPCNFVAGHSYDSPETLRAVADYLESKLTTVTSSCDSQGVKATLTAGG